MITGRLLLKNLKLQNQIPKLQLNRLSKNSLAVIVRNYSANVPPKGTNGMFRLGLASVTVGALVGTGYSIHKLNKTETHIVNRETVIPTITDIPQIEPSRKIQYHQDQTGLKLILYQYQTCPFCCKVRAFLDYHGISYDVIEVDPVLRQSVKWSPYKKVPILLAEVNGGYQPLNDSTMIISAIKSYLKDGDRDIRDIVKCYPLISYVDEGGLKKSEVMNRYFLMLPGENKPDNKTIAEERKWRKWADDVLVHMLSPNVYRTKEEALQAFNWFSEVGEWEKNFPAWERYLIIYVGAFAMWIIGKRLKERHHLKDDVRQSLYDECNFWVKEINKKGTKFMGGDEPNLADLAVYGVLNSIEGCTAFQDLLANSSIKTWYFDMKNAVKNQKGNILPQKRSPLTAVPFT